jgi:hypothetical protein
MNRLFYGLIAGIGLLANPAFAGQPVLVDGKGHAVVFDAASKRHKEGRLHLHAVQQQIPPRWNPLRRDGHQYLA